MKQVTIVEIIIFVMITAIFGYSIYKIHITNPILERDMWFSACFCMYIFMNHRTDRKRDKYIDDLKVINKRLSEKINENKPR